MKAGSIIIDLAVERGGNCEMAKPGEIVTTTNGVKIVSHLNVPGRLAATASQLYAKNLFAFVETLIDKKEKKLAVNPEDELVKATCLTGTVPSFISLSAESLNGKTGNKTMANLTPEQALDQARTLAEVARKAADAAQNTLTRSPQPPAPRPAARSTRSFSRLRCSPSLFSSATTWSGP